MKRFDLRLYGVTDRRWTGSGHSLEEQLEEALKGGITAVQLREKQLEDGAFAEEAGRMKKLTDAWGVPLLINDRVEVALACGAAGVHLGQQDMDPARARRLLGPEAVIGVTAKTVEQAQAAWKAGADYLGSGAVFGSSTKRDAVPMSLERFREIAASVPIPVVAIGGICESNLEQLAGSGAAGAALASGIFAAEEIEETVRRLRRMADRLFPQPV